MRPNWRTLVAKHMDMDKYLVVSEHTLEDCNRAIEHFREYHMNFITHFEWGCKDKDHHAYAMIEAESHAHAVMSVPPALRNKARAIKLVRFTGNEVQVDPLHG
jgi:hypothetical protein